MEKPISDSAKTNVSVEDIKENIENRVYSNKEKAKNQLETIISKLPREIRDLISDAYNFKRIPKEYLLSSILFAYSNAAGLAFKINCMNYTNYANLYFAILGSRGDVKSPAMELATYPLNEQDNTNYIEYKNKLKEWSTDDSFQNEETKPSRKQFLLQNATIESAMFTHLKNPYSIGVYVDELSFLIEKMANKNSNEGAVWRTFLLQGNTNKHVDISRKTTDSYRIEKSYPTLLGSIQYQFISKMFGNGNLESGLIDRLLFTSKLTNNTKLTKSSMPNESIQNYGVSLNNLLRFRNMHENNKTEIYAVLTKNAHNRIYEYSQKIINKQNKLTDQTYEYSSKMLINIHKLTLLIHLIKNACLETFTNKIELDSVELAILLNDFYLTNFKIILEKREGSIDKKILNREVIKLAKENNIEQKTIATLLGYKTPYISKLWKR